MKRKVIFKYEPSKFSKRFWRVLSPYAILWFVFSLLPFFNIQGHKGILALIFAIIALSFFSIAYSSYKWTLRCISEVVLKGDVFEIQLVEKDKLKTFTIHKDNIRTHLKWEGGRPRILVLTIFDTDTKIIELYSGGRAENEYVLEDIVLKIKNQLNENLN